MAWFLGFLGTCGGARDQKVQAETDATARLDADKAALAAKAAARQAEVERVAAIKEARVLNRCERSITPPKNTTSRARARARTHQRIKQTTSDSAQRKKAIQSVLSPPLRNPPKGLFKKKDVDAKLV